MNEREREITEREGGGSLFFSFFDDAKILEDT